MLLLLLLRRITFAGVLALDADAAPGHRVRAVVARVKARLGYLAAPRIYP